MLALLLAAAPVLHYVRSNSDGSEVESVVVYAESPESVRVFKGRERCTRAAYVTARLDPQTGVARSLVGGRLTGDLEQEPMAYLDAQEGRATVRLGDRNGEPVFDISIGDPWLLYDFDFASLIANPPAAIRGARDYETDLVLLLTGEPAPTFTNLGTLRLSYEGRGLAGGGEFLYYKARGPALNEALGEMWFGADDGRLIAARLPVPNHSEYRDFALRLVLREDGAEAWKAVLARHWAGCPGPR